MIFMNVHDICQNNKLLNLSSLCSFLCYSRPVDYNADWRLVEDPGEGGEEPGAAEKRSLLYFWACHFAPVRSAAARLLDRSPDLSSCRLHPPPSISGGDPSPDSLLQGPSWAAAAASCLLTPLPPLLPVLGQTRPKPPLLTPTPPLISHTHSYSHTQVVSIVDHTLIHLFKLVALVGDHQ